MHEFSPPTPELERLKKLDVVKVAFPERPTTLTFLLVNHRSGEDLPPDLPSLVEEHDMVILEGLGWHKQELDNRNAISRGDERALVEHNRQFELWGDRGFGAAINSAIFATGKPITYCDLPYSKDAKEAVRQRNAGADIKNVNSVYHAIARGRSYFSQTFNKFILQRDRYMIKNIYGIVESNSAGRDTSEPVKGLVIYGHGHYNVPEALDYKIKTKGLEDKHQINTIVYGEAPRSQNNLRQLYREYLKDHPLSDDLVIKALIESIYEISPEMAEALDQEYGESLMHSFAVIIGKA